MQIDEKALEAAARAYCLEIDVDPDMPHALASGAPAWWAVEAPYIRAAILAYESAKQKGEAEGWRTIESAPKDGAPFFGIGSDDAYPQPMRWQAYSDEEVEEIGETGYWAYCEDLIGDVTGSATPTHWRPMFGPPSVMLSAGGEG